MKKITTVPFNSNVIEARCLFQNQELESSAESVFKLRIHALKIGRFDFEMQFVATSAENVDYFQSIRVSLCIPGPITIAPQSIWLTGDSESENYKRILIKSNTPLAGNVEFLLNYNKGILDVSINKTKEGAELYVRGRSKTSISNSDSTVNCETDLIVQINGNKYAYKIPVHVMFDRKSH